MTSSTARIAVAVEDSSAMDSMKDKEVVKGSNEEIELESGQRMDNAKVGGVPAGDMIFTHKYRPTLQGRKEYNLMQTLVLAYQSLGVVYGDLGTSPLYVLPSATGLKYAGEDDLLGVLSLIFWTLTIIPLLKYVFIVLLADDHGEGGTFALYSYLCRHINFNSKLTIQSTRLESDSSMRYYTQGTAIKSKAKTFIEKSKMAQNLLTFVVMLGTSMVIGDGALTPATSVLSALAGIQTISSKLTTGYIVFIAVVLLVALFLFQSCGTSKVGFSFSPIMFLWFSSNVIIGVYNIVTHNPTVLQALSPHYIVKFFMRQGKIGWELLGAVFLCTTGAEAMFADLGHFNKRAIQLAFTLFVYPSLVLCYAGEVAYLTKHPDKISSAYYSSIPKPVYWPMFILATLSAIVASQSMISATFSIVKQSLSLGCFPRVNIKHTSSKHEGQIYCPEVNYILMVICIALVLIFKQGVEIGNAYGVAVVWVMVITTCLVTLVMLVIWDTNFLLILAFFVPFIFIEGVFVSSLLKKIPQGGWVPFAIAIFSLVIMISWTSGRSRKAAFEAERMLSLSDFNDMLSRNSLYRPQGICIFCTDLVNGIPPIVRHYLQSTNSLREITIIVTIRTLPIKTVLPEERLDVGKLGTAGVYRCLIQFGYNDPQSLEDDDDNVVTAIVAKLREISETTEETQKLEQALEKGVIFVAGRTILKSKDSNGWFSHILIDYFYRFFQKNSRSAISSLQIPPGRFLQVGMQYEI